MKYRIIYTLVILITMIGMSPANANAPRMINYQGVLRDDLGAYLQGAYDLTFSYSSYGFHSTMVAGESQNPGRKELMKLARHFGVSNAKTIIEQVQDAIGTWEETAKACGVTKENRESIQKAINKLVD